jgi:hypothetical protein
MESERGPSTRLADEDVHSNATMLSVPEVDGRMSKALWRVGRPVARAADGLRHNRDRYRHIRQFQHVTRVIVRTDEQDR